MTNEMLCLEFQQGNNEALEELWIQNIGLVETVIRKYRSVIDLDDARQQGFLGLREAALLYSADRGASFAHYSTFWIKQSVLRYIADCGSCIRIPVHQLQRMRNYHRAINLYKASFGYEPTAEELCFYLGINHDQLEDLKKDIKTQNVRSTSEPIGEDGESTLEDFIPDDRGDQYEDVIERLHHKQLAAVLWNEVDALPEQQRLVIRDRFQNGHTLKECGESLGLSVERIRAIQEKALRELRRGNHLKRLQPYLTDSGAYSLGLRNNGLSAFRRCGSTQERALMYMEERSRVNLWGREILNETSD